ncbi:MAG TPA: F0F1 ATP synthase subunit B [Candidatus Peribacteraceae bacterium]|nr:F0F1 ATP synthase subunit B [Candidatus Peribacteraceae bacterium]
MEQLLAKLGVNWPLLIAQMVNFLIVLGVLTALVYKPLLRLIDQRTERIRKAMEDAKRSEEEMLKLQERRRAELKRIDEESGRLLAEARKKAEVVNAELLQKAHAEAEAVIAKGRQELRQERAEALQEVKDVLSQAVVTLTEKLLEREFTDADQKKAVSSLHDSIPTLLK